MSTLPESTSQTDEDSPAELHNESAEEQSESKPRGYDPDELQTRLQPHISPKLAMGLPNLVVVFVFCALFFAFSYFGLRPLETFTHVAYGDWIISNGALPEADPFLELAAGMPVDNSAWLSQVIVAGVYRLAGAEALSTMFSLLKVAVFVVFGIAVYLRSRSLALVCGCVGGLALAYWVRLLESPIDVFGQLAFMTLLLLLVLDDNRTAKADDNSAQRSKAGALLMWIGLPVLFIAWVNLHVSFAFGLALLAAWAVGRGWDTWRRSGSLGSALADGTVQRRFWLLELAIVATLINPMLLGAWRQAFRIAVNTNLRDQLPYAWLSFAEYSGLVLAASALLTMFLLRKAKDFGGFELLGFVAFAAITAMTVYATPYLAAVVLVLASGHLAAMCGCCLGDKQDSCESPQPEEKVKEELPADAILAMEDEEEESALPPGRSFIYSLLCVLLIWLALMLTPTYDLVASPKEKQRTPAQLYGATAPWQVAGYLQENPLTGRIFAPLGWAGYLQVTNRVEGEPLSDQYYANAMIDVLPRRAWDDYMAITGAGRNWEETLDRYDIHHVIVDKDVQPVLTRGLRNNPDWQVRYEDDVAMVASLRMREISSKSETPTGEQNTGGQDEESAGQDAAAADQPQNNGTGQAPRP